MFQATDLLLAAAMAWPEVMACLVLPAPRSDRCDEHSPGHFVAEKQPAKCDSDKQVHIGKGDGYRRRHGLREAAERREPAYRNHDEPAKAQPGLERHLGKIEACRVAKQASEEPLRGEADGTRNRPLRSFTFLFLPA
jgi:hypothetical protein